MYFLLPPTISKENNLSPALTHFILCHKRQKTHKNSCSCFCLLMFLKKIRKKEKPRPKFSVANYQLAPPNFNEMP